MKLDPSSLIGKTIFVGIDVHKTTYSISVAVDGKVFLKVGSMPADPSKLIDFLKKRFPDSPIKSVYEAGFSGFMLHRVLIANGIDNIVINAASIEIAANNKVKTDKRDSVKLAEHLARGMLHCIHIPTPEQELARLITRTRAQLIKERSRFGVQIKSKLMQFGFIAADDKRVLRAKLLAEFTQLQLPPELAITISALADLWKKCNEQVMLMNLEISQQAHRDYILEEIYQGIPGIGPIIGRTLANELGDMSQFKGERDLYSFVGLTPSEHSSGEGHANRGRITKQGLGLIRGMLVEAAWTAKEKDPDLEKIYERLKVTRGGKRAIVAVARRLAGRIRACLRQKKGYELNHSQSVAA
jgi:transposase